MALDCEGVDVVVICDFVVIASDSVGVLGIEVGLTCGPCLVDEAVDV